MSDTIRLRWIWYRTKRLLFWMGGDRPWRMNARGRPLDNEFHPRETVHFRITAANLDDDGMLRLGAIRFPDQSVNREKYGEPTDVLIPLPRGVEGAARSKEWIYCGVAGFPVGCLPERLEGGKGDVICDIRIEHDPLEYNYVHAEIRAFLGAERLSDKRRVSRSQRKRFRMKIFAHATVTVRPLK